MTETTRQVFLQALCLIALGLLLWANARLPSGGTALGQYHDKPGPQDDIYISPDAPQSRMQATVIHELLHGEKTWGFLEQDVPIAAAAGYFTEWVQNGHIGNATHQRFFTQGLSSREPQHEVGTLLAEYDRFDQAATDSRRSADDGARLAGLTAQVAGKDLLKGLVYLRALGLGFDHDASTWLTLHPKVLGIAREIWAQQYTVIDTARLSKDMYGMDQESRDLISRFTARILEGFVARLGPNVGHRPYRVPLVMKSGSFRVERRTGIRNYWIGPGPYGGGSGGSDSVRIDHPFWVSAAITKRAFSLHKQSTSDTYNSEEDDSPVHVSFDEAQEFCKARHSDLASIEKLVVVRELSGNPEFLGPSFWAHGGGRFSISDKVAEDRASFHCVSYSLLGVCAAAGDEHCHANELPEVSVR